MRKFFVSSVILCMAITVNAQTYNKELAEAGDRIRGACLENIAPDGGKVQKTPFIFDVAKEYCLCVSDNFLAELSTLSGDLTLKKDQRVLQISLQCKERTLRKREPEALSILADSSTRCNMV